MFCQMASAVPRNQVGPMFIDAGTGSTNWSKTVDARGQARVRCRTSELDLYWVSTWMRWKPLLTRFESTKSTRR